MENQKVHASSMYGSLGADKEEEFIKNHPEMIPQLEAQFGITGLVKESHYDEAGNLVIDAFDTQSIDLITGRGSELGNFKPDASMFDDDLGIITPDSMSTIIGTTGRGLMAKQMAMTIDDERRDKGPALTIGDANIPEFLKNNPELRNRFDELKEIESSMPRLNRQQRRQMEKNMKRQKKGGRR